MTSSVPSAGIMETAKNARNFTKENMSVFWNIFKPFIVFITISLAIDLIVLPWVLPHSNHSIQISHIVSAYFLMCLAISWHRVVLHGPDQYTPMNPFKPQKDEWIYIAVSVLFSLMIDISIGAVIKMGFIINPVTVIPLAIVSGIILTIVFFKLLFFFPSRATGNTISLWQSFIMTNGYVVKLMLGMLVAALFYIIIAILYLLVSAALASVVTMVLPFVMVMNILIFLVDLPILLFLQPMLVIISVTVLSYYYQHALQNKGVPRDD